MYRGLLNRTALVFVLAVGTGGVAYATDEILQEPIKEDEESVCDVLKSKSKQVKCRAGDKTLLEKALRESKKPAKRKELLKMLSPEARAWYEENWIEILITNKELEVLAQIQAAIDLQNFQYNFWNERALQTDPDFPREFLSRVAEAKELYKTPHDLRARMFVLRGPPHGLSLINGRPRPGTPFISCDELNTIEIWEYARPMSTMGGRDVFIFYCPDDCLGSGISWKLWTPKDNLIYGSNVFLRRFASSSPGEQVGMEREAELKCPAIMYELERAASLSAATVGDFGERVDIYHGPGVKSEGAGGVIERSCVYQTPGAKQITVLDRAIQRTPSERSFEKMALDITFLISAEGLTKRLEISYNLSTTMCVFKKEGKEWIQKGNPFRDPFADLIREFQFNSGDVIGGALPLGIHAELVPGTYRVFVKIADANAVEQAAEVIWKEDIVIEFLEELEPEARTIVPEDFFERPSTAIPVARVASTMLYAGMFLGGQDEGASDVSAEAQEEKRTLPIEIVPVGHEPVTGAQRFEVVVTLNVKRVAYHLDGGKAVTAVKAPFSISFNLGTTPRVHELRAIAYDGIEEEAQKLGEDRYKFNVPYRAFEVRIISPAKSVNVIGSVPVRVAVRHLSEGQKVKQIEFYVNEELVGVDPSAPYSLAVNIPSPRAAGIRVVGELENGLRAESDVMVNQSDFSYEEHVNLVELYVTALAKDGEQVMGLHKDDFVVKENGILQEIHDIRTAYPLSIGMLLDTSASMKIVLAEALRAGRNFLDGVMRDGDMGFTMGIGEVPYFLAEPTQDKQVLKDSLLKPHARGNTALRDGIMEGIYYLEGMGEGFAASRGERWEMDGKRALVLLTGEAVVGGKKYIADDTASKADYATLLQYAKECDVTIYVIGIDIQKDSVEFRKSVEELARVTGGDVHYVDTIEELGLVYAEIDAELRSQYLLSYYSSPAPVEKKWQTIEVELKDKRVKAIRHKLGYFP